MNHMALPEKLTVNKYELDDGNPHVAVEQEICQSLCVVKACLFICPAGVYSEQDGKIIADGDGCLECGTCKIICDAGALSWFYPRGGFGILYRQG